MRERSIADQKKPKPAPRKRSQQRGRNTPSRSDILREGNTEPPGDRGSRELEAEVQGSE